MKTKDHIIFDIGGVLIGWDPSLVYNDLFDSKGQLEWFFQNVCTPDWNRKQDAGRTFEEATAELLHKFPEWERQIRAYYDRWSEMVTGEISASVEILKKLKTKDYQLYALTNWSAQSFAVIRETYDFFNLFDGIVVSAHERQTKPDEDIYRTLLHRYRLDPKHCIFIDDTKVNVRTADDLGMRTIHFSSPDQMISDLKDYEIL